MEDNKRPSPHQAEGRVEMVEPAAVRARCTQHKEGARDPLPSERMRPYGLAWAGMETLLRVDAATVELQGKPQKKRRRCLPSPERQDNTQSSRSSQQT